MTRSELKRLIEEVVQELDVGTYASAAEKYRSSDGVADSEANRQKVFKFWAKANEALLRDKNNFVYMSRANENQYGTEANIPFSIGKVGSVDSVQFGKSVKTITGKMYTSGGPGGSIETVEYIFETGGSGVWKLETKSAGPGKGPMGFLNEKDAGNFLKSLRNMLSIKTKGDPKSFMKIFGLLNPETAAQDIQPILQEINKIKPRAMENIGIRLQNTTKEEMAYLNAARDAAAAGQEQFPLVQKYKSDQEKARKEEPSGEESKINEGKTKLKQLIRETIEETSADTARRAKELTDIVLGDATKAAKKAALSELLAIAGETAIRKERDRNERARQIWGAPTHGW